MSRFEKLSRYYILREGSVMDALFMNQLYSEFQSPFGLEEWVVKKWDDDNIYIEKNNIRAYIEKNSLDDNSDINLTSKLILHIPLLELYSQPGFIIRQGMLGLNSELISRIYININSKQTKWILGELSESFDNNKLRFYLKILAHPKMYLRCDSCVIYVSSNDLDLALNIIKLSIKQNKINLTKRIPLMTMFIQNGIGIADEPSDFAINKISYGQWDSSLFVEGSKKTNKPNEIAKNVENLIIKTERNPDFPFLRKNRNLSDILNWSHKAHHTTGFLQKAGY